MFKKISKYSAEVLLFATFDSPIPHPQTQPPTPDVLTDVVMPVHLNFIIYVLYITEYNTLTKFCDFWGVYESCPFSIDLTGSRVPIRNLQNFRLFRNFPDASLQQICSNFDTFT